MPTINVKKDRLLEFMECRMEYAEFEEYSMSFGIELEEETIDEAGEAWWKLDIPANRVDLLCVEALGRALRIFKTGVPDTPFTIIPSDERTVMTVHSSASPLRPFIACAILRNIKLTQERYNSFIAFQEKLHGTLCRGRRFAAIGTHDLDAIRGPFTYGCDKIEDINFIPLNMKKLLNGREFLAEIEKHLQLRNYLEILKGSDRIPVVRDNEGRVLSVPPILNSQFSAISVDTRNIFVECTGTDLNRVMLAVTCLCNSFSMYCDPKNRIESVRIMKEATDSQKAEQIMEFPNNTPRPMIVNLGYVERLTSIPGLSQPIGRALLQRMDLPSDSKAENELVVYVPPNRNDIMHACDVAEDIAIAYGYNAIKPKCFDSASEQKINLLSSRARRLLSRAGLREALTWNLISMDHALKNLSRNQSDGILDMQHENDRGIYIADPSVVTISNPKTIEFQIVRPSLLPGILTVLANQKYAEQPLKIFEIGDVVMKSTTTETGATTRRHLAVAYGDDHTAGLEHVHGILDWILERHFLQSTYDILRTAPSKHRPSVTFGSYALEVSNLPTFIKGRQVYIKSGDSGNRIIGVMGTLNPDSTLAMGIEMPVSYFEINLEALLEAVPEIALYEE